MINLLLRPSLFTKKISAISTSEIDWRKNGVNTWGEDIKGDQVLYVKFDIKIKEEMLLFIRNVLRSMNDDADLIMFIQPSKIFHLFR